MEVFQHPMCLVRTDGGNKLKIEDKTVDQINQISWPLIIVAVVGLHRTGKSYLMNRLALSEKGARSEKGWLLKIIFGLGAP